MDTEGNVLAVAIDAADLSDAEGGRWVLARARARWPELVKGWADQTYRGALLRWALETHGIELEIVQRPAEAVGFVLLPRRWVVERTFAWLGRARRLSKEYEHHPDNTELVVYLASCQRLLHRLRPATSRVVPYARQAS